jgi:hypothetical protein
MQKEKKISSNSVQKIAEKVRDFSNLCAKTLEKRTN